CADLEAVRGALLSWFAANKRDLPWRVRYTPYEVWISEVMLQQTQMERGVAYFRRWMRELPSVAALAAADEATVMRLWEGLGYYSRARNLHAAAKIIAARPGGFPDDIDALRALPGVGEYTAAAIASIAFGRPVACVDANVERIVARLFAIDTPLREEPARSRVRVLAQTLLPQGKAREHNQAMMELGALVCGRKPLCGQCPLAPFCIAHRTGRDALLPVKSPRPDSVNATVTAAIVVTEKGVPLQKRPRSGIWPGLWQFPACEPGEGVAPEKAALTLAEQLTGLRLRLERVLPPVRHTYTNHRIRLLAYVFSPVGDAAPTGGQTPSFGGGSISSPPDTVACLDAAETARAGRGRTRGRAKALDTALGEPMPAVRFVPVCDLGGLAMPAPHRRLAEAAFAARRQAELPLGPGGAR
ncbi:MAG: A/G-specific adenine glycosylase, partial [Desulfovibrio sp.]|nr:A/G-specific adenine glycosylase [Desulfovibrio sp.]